MRNLCRAVMRGLRGRMDDQLRPLDLKQLPNSLPVSDISVVVVVLWIVPPQMVHFRTGGSGETKELAAHIIIDANNLPTLLAKEANAL
jgi:hypothetical protein